MSYTMTQPVILNTEKIYTQVLQGNVVVSGKMQGSIIHAKLPYYQGNVLLWKLCCSLLQSMGFCCWSFDTNYLTPSVDLGLSGNKSLKILIWQVMTQSVAFAFVQ